MRIGSEIVVARSGEMPFGEGKLVAEGKSWGSRALTSADRR